MKPYRQIAACIGILFCALANGAGNEAKLFKDYTYLSARDSYVNQQGYYDCSADVGSDALCKDDVRFMDHSFTAALVFSAGKLHHISLMTEQDQAIFAKLFGTLSQTFTLVALNDGKSQLDILHTLQNDRSAKQTITSFEGGGINGGSFTYIMLEKVAAMDKADSLISALALQPDTVRSADLMVVGQGADSVIVLKFALPKREAQLVRDAAQKPAESF